METPEVYSSGITKKTSRVIRIVYTIATGKLIFQFLRIKDKKGYFFKKSLLYNNIVFHIYITKESNSTRF